MKSDFSKQDFQELIEKYFDGRISLEEVKLLINYYHSFNLDNDWVEEIGPENSIKQRMLHNITEAIEQYEPKKSKIVLLFSSNVFRYGLAASIVFLVGLYFNFNNSQESAVESRSVAVHSIPVIPPGTNKAILTTENGAKIILENSNSYASSIVRSTGKGLVYSQNLSVKSNSYNYLTIPRGGQYTVKLSDGTQVWLNSESQLKYPLAFTTGKMRTVELVYGEAYFEVSPSTKHKGAHFKVYHKGQNIEVLGTEFNVKAYKDEKHVYTTLVKGKIAVTFGEKKENLIPNKQSHLDLDNNTLTVATIDVDNEISWKDGNFVFDGKSLKEIMKILSRWYDVEVVFQNRKLEDTKFIGVLGREQNLGDILTSIKDLGFIKGFEVKDKQVKLN